MTRSYLETVFRHKYIVIMPILIGFLVGAVVSLQVPRSYEAAATLWTDTAVPNESTVGTTGGQSPPSAGQVLLLNQLLQTRSFMRSVVNASPLADEYAALDSLNRDRLLWAVAATITTSTPGPQLVSMSVEADDPDEATGLAQAVLEEFDRAQLQQAEQRASAQAEYQKRRLEAAQQALADSPNEETSDAYAAALAAYEQSVARVAAPTPTTVTVVDQPDTAYPQPRMKTLVIGAGGGLMAGATLSLMALILLMSRDRSVRGEGDAVIAGLDVVGSIRHVEGSDRHPTRDRVPVSL